MYKIAIDTGPLYSGDKVRGIGVHTAELLKSMKILRPKDLDIEDVNFQSADLSTYDLIHYQNFNPFLTVLPEKKIAKRMLLTIHDLIYLIYPEKYKSGIRGKLNFAKQKHNLKNFDGIITISETSKKDISKYLDIPESKIHVTYLAPRNMFMSLDKTHPILKETRSKYELPEKFVLYVGDINYNKNIPTLINACSMAKVRLVMVGKHAKEVDDVLISQLTTLKGPRDYFRYLFGLSHPELAHYKNLAKMFEKNQVIRLGFVPDQDLVALYNLATIYCQPSYYEGFGLGVLEAMSCGCPVVSSKTSALTEVCGNAAIFANPRSKVEFSKKISKVINSPDLAKTLKQKGLIKAKEYSWKKTAGETIRVYRRLLTG